MLEIRALISSRIRIKILRILALQPENAYNINELSRLTGFSPRGVEKELKNLLSGGILRKEVTGNQHRYQLDPSCPIYLEIKKIIVKTVGIAELIKNALNPIKNDIKYAFVFGSFVSGDFGNDSDVDLFIITELSGLKLAALLSDVQSKTGRSLNVAQFTLDEFNRRKARNDHFLTRVLGGPKIEIIGQIDES
ncbi:MAG: nucleotidyltransferase domain-containing protein [Acidobacteriota bacterium]|nr:nucleotidyltransferase domain-containing protein [Acidobacteriota bacterium]